jgi:hypothetical protein
MGPDEITYFAETDYRNKRTPFGIKSSDRTRHTYVIGKTGMGKSTMLENMAIQDIQNGNGLAFVDPHGKSAELLLDYVPEHRIKDVLYFAPFDMEYPVAFNIMEDVGEDKRHLVVNGLMSTFEKIWVDAWSARMAYILSNTLLALLEYPGSTLLGINRMLSDKDYRKLVVSNVKDPSVRSFWMDEFAKYTDRYAQEATPAIQNKVGQFTSNPLIRNIVGQQVSTFDPRKMMDEKKIIIVNLSKGRVGEGNANLLGSMIITKIYLAAMSRADVPESKMKDLPNFYLYVDEFQSFANKSFADILSEARKYKLNLTMAHQYIEQMEEEVRSAVFGNVGTMIAFRVGAFDAEVLEKEFAPVFTAEDLVNLGVFQIYMKLMINGVSSSPFSATTLPPIEKSVMSWKEDIIASSRAQFAKQRSIVESDIRLWHDPVLVEVKKDEKKKDKDNRVETFTDKKEKTVLEKIEVPKPPTEEKTFAKAFEEAGVKINKDEEKKAVLVEVKNQPIKVEEVKVVNKTNVVSPQLIKDIMGQDMKVDSYKKNDSLPKNTETAPLKGFISNKNNRRDGDREKNVNALKEALSRVLKEREENNNSKNTELPKNDTVSKTADNLPSSVVKNENKKSANLNDAVFKNESRNSSEVSPEIIKKVLSSDEVPKL